MRFVHMKEDTKNAHEFEMIHIELRDPSTVFQLCLGRKSIQLGIYNTSCAGRAHRI